MNVLSKLDRLWRTPVPATRLAMLRWLVGGFALVYCTVRVVHLTRYVSFRPSLFDPIGVVSFLSEPAASWVVYATVAATLVSGVAFTAGYRFRFSGPIFAALLLWVTTYRNSWGMVFHTENLMVMHVLALAFSPAADALSLDAKREGFASNGECHGRYGWAINLASWITVLAYIIAGIAKMNNSGSAWLTDDILRNYIAYDNLRKLLLGDIYSPLGAWLVQFGWMFPPLAVATMIFEMGGPVAFLHKRLAKVWIGGIMAFHWGVFAVMAIGFPYPLSGLAFASFFDLEDLLEKRRIRRLFRYFLPPEEDAAAAEAATSTDEGTPQEA